MKILLITDGMDIGGAQTHVATLARGLKKRKIGVAVLSAGGREAEALRADGIAQYTVPFFNRSPVEMLRARHTIRRIAKEGAFDILHAHARYPAGLLRGCEQWSGNPACVVTAHAAFSATPLLRALCYWGRHTVAVSEDLRARLCDRFGVAAEAITVIPNGIDRTRFYPPKKDDLPPLHRILFASRLDEDCSLGAELLCDIAPALADKYPDLQITLAGGGTLLPYFFERAAQINRARDTLLVRTVGSISDMPSLFRQSRVFVGVSRAAMEAAVCGCAVILLGNEGSAGLLTPENTVPALSNFCCRGAPMPTAHHLFSELDSLFSSESDLRVRALAGRRWIEEAFDAEDTTEKTVALYQKILAGKGGTHA